MSEPELSSLALWGTIACVAIAWIVLSLSALWRAGRMTDRAQGLQDLTSFLDSMIRSDRRHPIWLWADGRMQADAGSLALVGLSEGAQHVDQLVAEGGVVPHDIVSALKKDLKNGSDGTSPYVVYQGKDRPRLIIDVQTLPTNDEHWPSSVLWVEEVLDRPHRGYRQGVRALELRLQDLSRAFNSLPFPVWVRGPDFSLIEVNHAYVDAVDGENVFDVVERGVELFDRRSLTSARKARDTGQRIRDRRFGVIDGQRRAFSVINIPIDDDGNTLGVAVDVTGEEEALSELSRVLESQSETLNRLRSPVAIFGPGQTLRFYNSAFARLSHLSEDILSSEIRHSELLDAMRENRRLPEQIDFQQWKKNVLRHYTTLLEPYEEMWHLPDGTAHRVVTQPHPLGGLLILFEDVTDRLALERSYNTLIAVQQETLDNMRESIAVFGTDARLQLSNPAFQAIWQLDDDVLEGKPHLSALVKDIPIDEVRSNIGEDQDFRTTLAAWVSEHTHRSGRWYRPDGVVVDYAIVPLPDGGVMLTQSDVTDSFKVEQALRERSNALEAADRLKSEFITNMSYELRTPLNSIIGFAEMLDQKIFGDLNDQQADYVKNILSASDDLKVLIADVLDLAVLDAGEAKLDLEETDVVSALSDAATLAADIAGKVDIVLSLEGCVDVGVIIADSRRLKQIFYNMVSSMLNFARYGGALSVKLTGDDEGVSVTVFNPDSGLTPRERDRLISTVAMGASPGGRRATGLDLALVRSIVGLHHGRITLEPYGDEGLSLSCRLPRAQPDVTSIH
ncbi:sensor histidine kinase [Kordiimonas aestuarii]|uniref:sensor histidine kinase n=1 Tax=Kordiimonas aestuarii TaxID=1005925 RepID=UPI0021D26DC2|nr:PAS domain-containing sensor histidine kinase [Kordiimonas aestuarii]